MNLTLFLMNITPHSPLQPRRMQNKAKQSSVPMVMVMVMVVVVLEHMHDLAAVGSPVSPHRLVSGPPGPAEKVQQARGHKQLLSPPAAHPRHMWIHELQEVVDMADHNAEQVSLDGVADEEREEQQHPRQVRGSERKQAKETHSHVRVLRGSAPDVYLREDTDTEYKYM